MSESVDLLELITNKQLTPNKENKCTLYISGGENENIPAELSCLTYTGESDNDIPIGSVIFNREKTSSRPLKCTELNSRLRNRFWNRSDGCRVIDNSGNLYYKSYEFGGSLNELIEDIDILPESANSLETGDIIPSDELFKVNDNPYSGVDIEYISAKYQQFFGNGGDQSSTSDSYFGAINSNIENNTVLNIIKANSTTYTDTVDLNTIISLVISQNVRMSAELTVEYSINGAVYCNDIIVPVLIAENKVRTIENTIEEINNKVSVEYIDGVIKICPMIVDIDECIISRCSLNITYEN